MEDTWTQIKKLYKKLHNIPPRVVDYMAVEPVLFLSVSGRSNDHISKKMDLPIDYVCLVLMEFLKFPGWNKDLDISPIVVYNKSDRNRDVYKYSVRILSKLIDAKDLDEAYRVCQEYSKIRKEIEFYVI